ncbi:MAG: phage major capsid protein [Firmicutes bacterium]|nr:phage major capsid protein [Bacillota bacterium]
MLKKRMKEIEKRLAEIKSEVEKPDANLDALEEESRKLSDEYEKLQERVAGAERRQKILDGAQREGVETRRFGNQEQDTEERSYGADSPEYRSAYLKQMRGIELSDVEERAMTSASSSAGPVIPTQTMNKIISKLHQYAPLLDEIELLSVPGNVKVPAEGTTIEASIHAEGATITAAGDTMTYVELGMYEITKLITISKTVELMSVDAFENWLTDKIARNVADKITGLILTGTGSSQAHGINAITWDESNSVTVAKASALTVANIDSVVGLLNGAYDAGAKWIMSKKTFFGDFRALQDNSKNKVISKEGDTWYVEGYPVSFDERMTIHEAILGNLRRGYIGNMPEEAHVTSQFVVRENSYDFLGSAMFDGKVQAVEAFVKIAKATA